MLTWYQLYAWKMTLSQNTKIFIYTLWFVNTLHNSVKFLLMWLWHSLSVRIYVCVCVFPINLQNWWTKMFFNCILYGHFMYVRQVFVPSNSYTYSRHFKTSTNGISGLSALTQRIFYRYASGTWSPWTFNPLLEYLAIFISIYRLPSASVFYIFSDSYLFQL